MKKTLVVALVCLNVVLLVALVAGPGTQQARAQTMRGASDYIMITGKINKMVEALYVLDLKTRRLAAWRFDPQRRRLVPYRSRRLADDFKKVIR